MFITEEKLKNISDQLNGTPEDKILAIELLTALMSDEKFREDNLAQTLWLLRFQPKLTFGPNDSPFNKSVDKLLDALKLDKDCKSQHVRARYRVITSMKYRDVLNCGSPKGKAIVLKFFAYKLQDIYITIPKLKTKITFEYDGIEYV